jgi:hypothetical protein
MFIFVSYKEQASGSYGGRTKYVGIKLTTDANSVEYSTHPTM